jgi:hypothetical protein
MRVSCIALRGCKTRGHGAAQSSLRRLRKLVCVRAFAHPTRAGPRDPRECRLIAHSGTELKRQLVRSWRKLTLRPWRICWSTAEAAYAQVPRAGFSFGHPRL